MPYYPLEGRTDLLPEAIWGGTEKTIWLAGLPQVRPPVEPWFWVVDGRGARLPLAWPGGTALDDPAGFAPRHDRAALRSPRPLMSYAPCHPHRIPPGARNLVRHVLGLASRLRRPEKTAFPRWPVEPTWEVSKAVARAVGRPRPPGPWPRAKRYALCLSHDVDSARGQRHVPPLAEIEERLGLRSAWFLAPGNYRVDHGLWREMAARGHEIGSHGWAHDFKLAYLDPRSMARRLDHSRQALAQYPVAGFRSPAFLRTPRLWDAVAARFRYDSSIPDTLRLHGSNGSGSVFPYRLGRLVEVPVTLPYDGELMALGWDRAAREALWLRKARWIRGVGGLVHLLTHPDPQFTASAPERDLYRRVLEKLLAGGDALWGALPREIAAAVLPSEAKGARPALGTPAAAGQLACRGATSVTSPAAAQESW